MMRRIIFAVLCMLSAGVLPAQKTFTLASPDGKVTSTISVGDNLTYDIRVDGRQVLAPSAISMKLTDGTEWGVRPRIAGKKQTSINEEIASPLTRQATMKNECNVLTLSFKGQYAVEFRALSFRYIKHQAAPKSFKIEGTAIIIKPPITFLIAALC